MTVLRALLWKGEVDFQGQFFKVKATLPRPPQTPILISALRTGAAKSDRPVPPLDSLVVSGDDAAIAARFNELLETGLDELLVMAVPVAHPQGEQARLARLIGQL